MKADTIITRTEYRFAMVEAEAVELAKRLGVWRVIRKHDGKDYLNDSSEYAMGELYAAAAKEAGITDKINWSLCGFNGVALVIGTEQTKETDVMLEAAECIKAQNKKILELEKANENTGQTQQRLTSAEREKLLDMRARGWWREVTNRYDAEPETLISKCINIALGDDT